jgi:hypothetical protein
LGPWHQLQLAAGRGQADHAGAVDVEVHVGGHGRRLRGTPGGEHHGAAAARLHRQSFQPPPQVLGQRRGGIEDHLEVAEEAVAQFGIPFQIGDEHVEAARHVEVQGGRDLPQVRHGLVDQARHRLAVVHVQGAAVGQDHVEAQAAPGAALALRQEHPLGRLARPFLQELAQAAGVGLQAVGRAQDHGTVAAALHLDPRLGEGDARQRRGAGFRCRAGHGVTPG